MIFREKCCFTTDCAICGDSHSQIGFSILTIRRALLKKKPSFLQIYYHLTRVFVENSYTSIQIQLISVCGSDAIDGIDGIDAIDAIDAIGDEKSFSISISILILICDDESASCLLLAA